LLASLREKCFHFSLGVKKPVSKGGKQRRFCCMGLRMGQKGKSKSYVYETKNDEL